MMTNEKENFDINVNKDKGDKNNMASSVMLNTIYSPEALDSCADSLDNNDSKNPEKDNGANEIFSTFSDEEIGSLTGDGTNIPEAKIDCRDEISHEVFRASCRANEEIGIWKSATSKCRIFDPVRHLSQVENTRGSLTPTDNTFHSMTTSSYEGGLDELLNLFNDPEDSIIDSNTSNSSLFGINNDISTKGDTNAFYIAASLVQDSHVAFADMQAVLSTYMQKMTVIDHASDHLQGEIQAALTSRDKDFILKAKVNVELSRKKLKSTREHLMNALKHQDHLLSLYETTLQESLH